VQIAVGSEQLWTRFAAEFGLPTTGEFATNPDRVRNSAIVRGAVDNALRRYSTTELLKRLQRIGTPAAKSKICYRSTNGTKPDPKGSSSVSTIRISAESNSPARPLRFFDNAGQQWHHQHTAPPLLGQHTDEIFEWLSTPAGDVAEGAAHPSSHAGRVDLLPAR
jgi:formyl-CoA transferase